jgi:hypothetical protein
MHPDNLGLATCLRDRLVAAFSIVNRATHGGEVHNACQSSRVGGKADQFNESGQCGRAYAAGSAPGVAL